MHDPDTRPLPRDYSERQYDKALIKESLKEVHKEWMDEKLLTFGRWSVMGISAAFLAAVVWFILTMNGWRVPL